MPRRSSAANLSGRTMTRRAAVLVVGLVAAALVGVALLAVPGSPLEQRPTLGLDLQGGLEVTLQAVPPKDRKLTKEDLDRSVSIMRSRVDKLGVAEPEIRTQGSDQISIQLPGVKDPAAAAADHRQDRAARALRPRARPRLALDRRAHEAADRDAEALRPARGPAGARREEARRTPTTCSARRGRQLVRGPVQTKEAALAKWGGKLPPGHKLFAVPPNTVVVSCGAGDGRLPRRRPDEPDRDVLVPDAVHAARGAGDDREGPEALGHAPGLRHARPASPSS